MPDISGLVDAVRRHYDDGCFACGRENPIGLHLDDFSLNDGRVCARFTPRPEYRGAGKTLHGGIAATALDEILVWAGILTESVLTVTGTLEIRFRRPVRVDDPIAVSAVVDGRSGRRLQISGSLAVGEETRVEAAGLYLVSMSLDEILAGHRVEGQGEPA
ncbi:MAG TPA: PaaI family thioesterase [Acidimicrobiia bacterium]